MNRGFDRDPPRLLDGAEPTERSAARLLSRLPEPEAPGDVSRLWPGVRLRRPFALRAWPALVSAGALALAVVLCVWAVQWARGPLPVAGPVPTARILLTAGAVIDPGAAALQAGVRLGEASAVRTSPQGRALVELTRARALVDRDSELELERIGEHTALKLVRGRVLASVDPRRPGASFVVEVDGYRVTVKGTIFDVKETSSGVEVSCARGEVEVSSGGRSWSVPAGRSWTGTGNGALAEGEGKGPGISTQEQELLEVAGRASDGDARVRIEGPEGTLAFENDIPLGAVPVTEVVSPGLHHFTGRAPSTAESLSGEVVVREGELALVRLEKRPEPQAPDEVPAPPAPAPSPTAGARDFYAEALAVDLRGDHVEAARLLREIVARRLPNADLALYHLGELDRKLGAPERALQEFLRYERTHPAGALAQEAALSAVDLQVELGDQAGAAAHLDRFMRAWPHSERASEVHRLRGDLLRKAGDCGGAVDDYAQVRGEQAEDALFYTAACQRSLGRPDRATEAERSYLSRFPSGRHVAAVRQALGSTP